MKTELTLPDLVERYNAARLELLAMKAKLFPIRSRVRVDCAQYRGFGIVQADGNNPDDMIAVRLENHNVWWYPILDCKPVDKSD